MIRVVEGPPGTERGWTQQRTGAVRQETPEAPTPVKAKQAMMMAPNSLNFIHCTPLGTLLTICKCSQFGEMSQTKVSQTALLLAKVIKVCIPK